MPDGRYTHRLHRKGRHVATASTDGLWLVHVCPVRWGRTSPPTLEAAKAAVEAELWAHTAQGLEQW